MKKVLSLLLALTLSLALAVPAFAAELKSFKDVPSTHWAHDAIMEMVDMGLLAGTTAPDANGVGTFSPDSSMNRSHFVVVIARYLYGEELTAMPNGEKWYSSAYTLLLNKGILKKTDFENGSLDVAMSRQEMAYVLAKAADAQGKAPDSLVASSKIPDYNKISTQYKDSVVKAYSMGLIAGTDSKGTFNPYGTLNRAQASTVIYRLIGYKGSENNGVANEPVKSGWDGKGVNLNKFWDPENPLDGMPNTAAVGEKYGNKARGYGYAIAMNFVNIDSSIITNGLVLNGFSYTSNHQDRYDTAIAMLKDVLDAESANALINWIEELDRLHSETFRLVIEEDLYYGDAKFDESNQKVKNHIAMLADWTTMGNVQVRFASEGNNDMFLIKNN